jgi:hypothetical protein
MNAMSNDETQNELLDAEFRQILLIIKPHINDVDNPYHLAKYRVWLERLNAAGPAEKLERNKYLLELANQIHDKAVLPPFTYNPPKGPSTTIQDSPEGTNRTRFFYHFHTFVVG